MWFIQLLDETYDPIRRPLKLKLFMGSIGFVYILCVILLVTCNLVVIDPLRSSDLYDPDSITTKEFYTSGVITDRMDDYRVIVDETYFEDLDKKIEEYGSLANFLEDNKITNINITGEPLPNPDIDDDDETE